MSARYLRAVVGAMAFGLALVPVACGDSGGGDTAGNGGGSASAGKGGSGNSAATGNGGGLNLDSGVNSDSSTLDDASACATEYQKAELLPLDLYVMFDKSGSMNTGGKWTAAVAAMDGFVKDPQSSGIGVGLDFFPDGDECNVGTYSTPSVPIALLPGNQPAISSALTSTGPSGGTPTFPAMQGALSYAQTYAIQNPTHVVVIVLATDGQPNDCSSNVSNVSGVAAQGVAGTPKVLTFVIGVGTALQNLDAIAAAGGTNKAFIVDTAGNVTQQFIDALNAIRGAALACEYLIPTPKEGVIDFGKVNVEYTPGSGGAKETWPKYADVASCPASGDGWYYDNNSAPTKILLCPNTCNKVKADTNGSVGVLFGCGTIGPA